MAGLYWSEEEVRLVDFTAVSKSKGNTVISVKLETAEPYAVASIMAELKRAMEKQAARREMRKAAEPPRKRAVEHRPTLALTYQPKGDGT